FTALFVLRFRRPIAHLIRNQPLERRLKGRALHELVELVGSLWFVPVLLLVGTSLFATFVSAADSSVALRRALLCAMLAVVAMTVIGLLNRRSGRDGEGHRRSAPYVEQLQKFGLPLVHLFVVLFFVEVGLRVWGMSLIRYA